MQLVEVGFERRGSVVLVDLSGEVDMSNAASVRLRIAEFLTSGDAAAVVDLAPLTFIDSAGLHALVELGAMLEERRQQLLLCVPPGSQVRRTIEVIGMPRAVSVHPDRASAMDAALTSTSEHRPFAPPDDSA